MAQSPRPRLAVAEAAAALGVSVKTVRRWADQGHLPHERTPTGYRTFDPAVIAARAKGASMDQDTFADLAANVARLSAELEQMHRDIATLCGTLAQIVSYATPGVLASALDSDAPMESVQEAKVTFEQITERIVDVMRRHEGHAGETDETY